MNVWFIISLVANGVLAVVVYIGWTALGNVVESYNRLLRSYELACKTPPKIQTPALVVKQSFDAKTISLIKLSVGTNNQDEARNAAVEACKRIHKVIK